MNAMTERREVWAQFDTEEGVVEMPLTHLLAPHRPGDFSKVIYKDENWCDLRPENLLRVTDRQAEIWYLLLALVGTDQFDEAMTLAINTVSGDRTFLREMLDWFDPTEPE
jgi:hypothetical protein